MDAVERGAVLLVAGWHNEVTVRGVETAPPPDAIDWWANREVNEKQETWFEVKVVDEVGKPVGGLEVAFGLSGEDMKIATNGAGIARVEGAFASRASVSLVSLAAARKALKVRWTKPRPASVKEARNVLLWPVTDAFPTRSTWAASSLPLRARPSRTRPSVR